MLKLRSTCCAASRAWREKSGKAFRFGRKPNFLQWIYLQKNRASPGAAPANSLKCAVITHWAVAVAGFLQRYNSPLRERAACPGTSACNAAVRARFEPPRSSMMTTAAHSASRHKELIGSLKASTFIVTRRVGVAHRAPQKRTVQIQSCQSSNDLIPRTRHAMTGIKTVHTDTAPQTANLPDRP